jgi:hypothetical protein
VIETLRHAPRIRRCAPDALFGGQPLDQGTDVLLDRIKGLLQIAYIGVVVGPQPS